MVETPAADLVPYENSIREISALVPTVAVRIPAAAVNVITSWANESSLKALHEAGHAVACCVTPGGPRVEALDIRLRSGGRTETADGLDSNPAPSRRSQLQARMVVAMAGLAAEVLLLDNDPSDGSRADLELVTSIALDMAAAGILPGAPAVSRASYGFNGAPRWVEDETAKAVAKAIEAARRQADEIVSTHQSAIVGLARILVEHRRLSGTKLETALRSVGLSQAERSKPTWAWHTAKTAAL